MLLGPYFLAAILLIKLKNFYNSKGFQTQSKWRILMLISLMFCYLTSVHKKCLKITISKWAGVHLWYNFWKVCCNIVPIKDGAHSKFLTASLFPSSKIFKRLCSLQNKLFFASVTIKNTKNSFIEILSIKYLLLRTV